MQWCRMAMGSGDVKNVEIKGGKMKPEDVEFIRDEHVKVETCRNPDCETCPERSTFLRLLTESEAMREKAEHELMARDQDAHEGIGWHFCDKCNRSDADWIAAKKKEWGI